MKDLFLKFKELFLETYVRPECSVISWVLLRLFGLTTLAAFLSFGVQAQVLIGSDGIFPIPEFLENIHASVGNDKYLLVPMLFWFESSDLMVLIIWSMGCLFSVLLLLGVLPRISLLGIYVCYLSLYYAG